jgi:hypothetical protein
LAGVSPTSPGAEDASIDGVPVWFEFLDGQPGCLVFDPERCFHITRWQLAEDIPGARYFDGTLSVNVREIDDSYAATLLADNPNLSVSEDGDQLTTDEAIRRLRRLVQVQAMTKSRLDLIDADAAVWIPISTPRKSKFTHVSGPPIV